MFKILSKVNHFFAKKWVKILTAIIGVITAIGFGYWKVFIHPDKTAPGWLLITAVIASVLAAISALLVAALEWKLMKLQRQLVIIPKKQKITEEK
jgi:uncharacterized membrane protein YedE/YeeE